MLTKVFDKIINENIIFDKNSTVEANAVMNMALPLLNDNMNDYVKFKNYLLDNYPVTFIEKRNRTYEGIALKITRDLLDIEEFADDSFSRFFITSAQAGSAVHEGFLSTIDGFCNHTMSAMVILPTYAHVKSYESQPIVYDPTVMSQSEHFATTFHVNENLVAMDLKVLPQQRDPLFGMVSWCKDGKSVIVASPQQRYETVGVSNTQLPRCIMSTGSCTLPWYQDNRIGHLAEKEHVTGGVIVETNGKTFHARHVQAYSDGSFIDVMGANGKGAVLYKPDGSIGYVRPEAAILGDIHSDLLDEAAWVATVEILRLTRPKKLILHDLYDGNVNNPHHKGKALDVSQKRFNTLKDELDITRSIFSTIVSLANEIGASVVVVASNHDDFLRRHLNSMDWRYDNASNISLCAKMFAQECDGINSLATYIDPDGEALWLNTDDDYFVAGFQLGNHGHKGSGGSKGSLKNIEKTTYSVIAHSHKPSIYRGSIQVGCLCELQQEYNKGLREHLHSLCLVFPERHFSHITIIDGQWRAE